MKRFFSCKKNRPLILIFLGDCMFIKSFLLRFRNKFFLNAIRSLLQDVCGTLRSAMQEQKNQLAFDFRTIVQQECEPRLSVTVQTVENNRFVIGEYISKFISAAITNRETFFPYKNSLRGKNLVICGAGPSLSNYKPIDSAVHLALNRAFLFDKVNFDFIYAQDFDGIKMCQKELVDYKGNNCVKFFGRQYSEVDWIRNKAIPKSLVADCQAKEFYNDVFYPKDLFDCKFVPDIDSRAVACMPNVGLGVMQFALYMQPKKIYLVGLDHSGNHFTEHGQTNEEKEKEKQFTDWYWDKYLERSRQKWEECKAFAKVYYPETEIISINPVGLKGIFKDWYQSEGEEPK